MLKHACVLALIALPLSLQAQTTTSYSNTGDSIVVPGMPFHAERVTHAERKLADDSVQSRETHSILDRDAQGRVLVENTTVASGGAPPARPGSSFELIDPTAHQSVSWSTVKGTTDGTKVALSRTIGSTTHVRILASPLAREENLSVPKGTTPYNVVTEDLGKRTIAGLACTGKRTTTTVPVGRMNNAKPLVVTQEVWTSPDLQLTVLEIDKSPFTGTLTTETIKLSRDEPPATLFKVPDDYTVKPFPMGGLAAGMSLGTLSPAP